MSRSQTVFDITAQLKIEAWRLGSLETAELSSFGKVALQASTAGSVS